jgi:hypothetical protein
MTYAMSLPIEEARVPTDSGDRVHDRLSSRRDTVNTG